MARCSDASEAAPLQGELGRILLVKPCRRTPEAWTELSFGPTYLRPFYSCLTRSVVWQGNQSLSRSALSSGSGPPHERP